MASITASNPQRQNRWLLIGAGGLALAAGLMVALVLANSNGANSKPGPSGPGDQYALVAKQTIPANKAITLGMFDRVQVDSTVPNVVSDESAAVGKITRTEILKGEQLSASRLALVNANDPSIGPRIPSTVDGARQVAYPIPVNETKSVAGLIVPGDRVDLIAVFRQKAGDTDQTRVETILQNIEVLAFGTDTIDAAATRDANGAPLAGSTDQRKPSAKPNPGGSSVTLALTPQQVQTVAAVLNRAEISLALRQLGDDTTHPLANTILTDGGFGR